MKGLSVLFTDSPFILFPQVVSKVLNDKALIFKAEGAYRPT